MDESLQPPPSYKKRNRILWILSIVFLLILIGWILYYVLYGRFYVTTEDAYVAGNQIVITPQVESGVVAIFADNTDLVQQGQVIVELDPSNYLIAVEEKKRALATMVRTVSQLFENVGEQEALVGVRRAELIQQKLYLSHRIQLRETGAIAEEEFEKTSTDVSVAESYYAYALKALQAAKALVADTTVENHPRVQDAVYSLKEAYLNLIRCQLIAPATGYVAKRSVQVGDWVRAGTTLMMVVPLDYLWFDANYKETQLKNVRIGQPVTFTADLYGKGVKFHGSVVGFTGGTGSAFQLLPAQNASGNWIKIVQRLPVRVSINSQDLKEHPLFIGLSIHSTIDVSNTEGDMLCQIPQVEPVYSTFIYYCQMEQLKKFEPEIAQIISSNQVKETCSTP